MKTLITFLVTTLFAVTGFAQYTRNDDYQRRHDNQRYGYGQTVVINISGNDNAYLVRVDGRNYSAADNNDWNNGGWNRNASNKYAKGDITIDNVQPGQHTIEIYRNRNYNNNGRGRNNGYNQPVYSSAFNVRQGYDVRIEVRGNGQVQMREMRDRDRNNNGGWNDRDRNNNGGWNNGGYGNNVYRTPMADYQFSELYQNVKSKWFQNNKISAIRDAFNTSSNYFSTYQIMQLLQLINTENNRLGLAKESYRVVSDPSNFTQVYSLFSQTSREELDRYIRSYRYN